MRSPVALAWAFHISIVFVMTHFFLSDDELKNISTGLGIREREHTKLKKFVSA